MVDFNLAQRGRASVDFLCDAYVTYGVLLKGVEQDMAEKGLTAETLPDDMDERHRLIEQNMADSKSFKIEELLSEWSQMQSGQISTEAFEDILPSIQAELDRLDACGPTTIDYGDGNPAPDYWKNVWFHRTKGGWDAHKYHGFIHSEFVHKRLVNDQYNSSIYRARRIAAQYAPQNTYSRILDMGASSGHFTSMLAETYPAADITGIDLSPRMLEEGRRRANADGLHWKLMVRRAEQSGLPAQSFDLVASFILIHEIPADIVRACIAEAYRLLIPGGDIMFADAPRFANINKLSSWKQDWIARYCGEPYWRESAEVDVVAEMQHAGFVDVEDEGHQSYPYMVRGRKPE